MIILTKTRALKYLVKNEVNTSEWKDAAMYNRCKKIITSHRIFFTKYELDKMVEEVRNM